MDRSEQRRAFAVPYWIRNPFCPVSPGVDTDFDRTPLLVRRGHTIHSYGWNECIGSPIDASFEASQIRYKRVARKQARMPDSLYVPYMSPAQIKRQKQRELEPDFSDPAKPKKSALAVRMDYEYQQWKLKQEARALVLTRKRWATPRVTLWLDVNIARRMFTSPAWKTYLDELEHELGKLR